MTLSEKSRYGKVVDIEEKLSRVYLDAYGREMPDPTPIAPPVGYTKQPTMVDHVRALVARHISEAAAGAGAESFEEANDFEVGDDYEPETPYEQLGVEGELGALPPEVARMTPAERAELIRQRHAQAQAEHLKSTTPGAGGGAAGGSPQTPPAAPPSTPVQTSPASSPDTARAPGST